MLFHSLWMEKMTAATHNCLWLCESLWTLVGFLTSSYYLQYIVRSLAWPHGATSSHWGSNLPSRSNVAVPPAQKLLCLHLRCLNYKKQQEFMGGKLCFRQGPGSGSCVPGPVIPDLANLAPPTSCPDNGQSQGDLSSGLIGRQWLHSPPPPPLLASVE